MRLFSLDRAGRVGLRELSGRRGGPAPAGAAKAQSIPARWPALLYFCFAHLSLASAFAAAALDPAGLAGFFYHPHLVAVVHLVTLGWLGSSILGSLYLVGPLALRMPLPAGRLDILVFAGFAVGVTGMVSHFWIDELEGVAWAGALVTLGILAVALRVMRALPRASVPRGVKLPVGLALFNLLAAALFGLCLAVNKASPFLPFAQLSGALGHAHLAGLGAGVMMVLGAGSRMLPMLLPAAMPRGGWLVATALLLQSAAMGLALALPLAPRLVPVAACAAALGVAAFLRMLVWMLRNPRPAPRERPRPDWSVAHALASFFWLASALAAGLYLAVAAPSTATLRVAMAYGVCGLVGFLAQIVVGVEGRLLPLAAWLWAYAERGFEEQPPSLHAAPARGLQALGFALWSCGVPLLLLGLALDQLTALAAGAGALFAAVVAGALNGVLLLRRLAVRG